MADTLASPNPSLMVIVPDFPPFFPVSRPQQIREHRHQWEKETEGKEVASYRSRTCTRSIGAVMGAKKHSLPLAIYISDFEPSISPIKLRPSHARPSYLSTRHPPHFRPYPLTFDPKSLIAIICVCVCPNAKNSPRR